jgi:hypothetical protein
MTEYLFIYKACLVHLKCELDIKLVGWAEHVFLTSDELRQSVNTKVVPKGLVSNCVSNLLLTFHLFVFFPFQHAQRQAAWAKMTTTHTE